MVALLTGLMLGSLRKVWPWKETIESRIVGEKFIPIVQSNVLPEGFGGEVVSAICLMVTGLLAVLLLERMGRKE